MNPQVKILAISNVYCRMMHFIKAGDLEEGHYHSFDHGTLLSKGRLRVEIYGEDELSIESSKDFIAPSFVFVDKNKKHRITSLEDDTVACCIHALRDMNEDIIDPAFIVEQAEFADSADQRPLPSIGEFLAQKGIVTDFSNYKPIASDKKPT
jgi:hypothetical protein